MRINKTLTALIAGASIGMSGQAFSAATPLTEAGTEITNKVTLDYSVDGQDQDDVASADLSFLVDTKVDFTLILQDEFAIPVTPGKEHVAAYLLTNTGNSTIEFSLGAANTADNTLLTAGTDNLTDNVDFTGLGVVGETAYDTASAAPTSSYAGDEATAATAIIPANFAQVVYAVVTAAGTDLDEAVITLTATASKSTDKVGTETTITSDSRSDAFDPDTVQFVFADSSNNGEEDADSGFKVVSAKFTHDDGQGNTEADGPGLTVTVINDPICEPGLTSASTNDYETSGCAIIDSSGGSDTTHYPKAIPGAMVKYTVTAENTGNATAEGVTFVQDLLSSHADNVNLQIGSLGNVTISHYDDSATSTIDRTGTDVDQSTANTLSIDFAFPATDIDIAVNDSITITFTAIAE